VFVESDPRPVSSFPFRRVAFILEPSNLQTFQPSNRVSLAPHPRPPGSPSSPVKAFPSQTVPFSPAVRHHKSFSCNTYESPRKCCKQKTYSLAKPFRCNTYKKHRGGGILPILACPERCRRVYSERFVRRVHPERYVRRELHSFSRGRELLCVPGGDDADSASQCSSRSLRKAFRCKSPELPCRRCPPVPFRPCGFPAETL